MRQSLSPSSVGQVERLLGSGPCFIWLCHWGLSRSHWLPSVWSPPVRCWSSLTSVVHSWLGTPDGREMWMTAIPGGMQLSPMWENLSPSFPEKGARLVPECLATRPPCFLLRCCWGRVGPGSQRHVPFLINYSPNLSCVTPHAQTARRLLDICWYYRSRAKIKLNTKCSWGLKHSGQHVIRHNNTVLSGHRPPERGGHLLEGMPLESGGTTQATLTPIPAPGFFLPNPTPFKKVRRS